MKLLEKYKMDLIVGAWESYRQAVLSLLEPNDSAVVLDLGSGEGQFTRRIQKRVGSETVFGSDLARKVEETNFYGWDLNNAFPPPNRSFDIVVASHIIEHLHNTDLFMKEIRRVLKDDGYAIVSTPNLAAWHNVLYLVLGRQPETAAVSDEMYPWVEAPGHRRIFTATELLKFVAHHGFTVQKLVGSTYYPLPSRLACVACKLDWRHAVMITVKVRKDAKT